MGFALNATRAGADETRTTECATASEAHCSLTQWLYDDAQNDTRALDVFDAKIAAAAVNHFREPFAQVVGGVVYSCVAVCHD